MLAAKLYKKMDLRLEETAIPAISDSELLIRVKAAAICGTDLRMYLNGAAGASPDHPLVLGHEFAGVIAAAGPRVPAVYPVGAAVAVAPNFGCGVCDFCVSGNSHMCPDYQAFGINLDGAFAEFVRVPEQTIRQGNVALLPEGVSYAAAALNEPFSCVLNGFERNQVRPGDTVLIIGSGVIGIMHAMLAWMAGAALVAVSDLSDERLELAQRIVPGIETVNGAGSLAAYTRQATGGKGFDAIVTAAPVPQIQQQSLELAAVNGRVCFFGGLPKTSEIVPLNTNLIHYRQLIVSGTTRASLRQYRQTLHFIASRIVDVDCLVTARGSLRDLPELLENARLAQGLKNVVEFVD